MFQIFLVILDLAGTFVFALSGALAGSKRGLDLFGIIVLAFAAGNFGGISRDVMIGAVPPSALSSWHALGASLVAGLIAFFWRPKVERLQSAILILDGAGLGLFAVAGTQKALAYGLPPVTSALLGMLTGIGGGILRDVLLREVPTVLHSEIYATAALAGATPVALGHVWGWPSTPVALVSAALCFGLRMTAIRRKWRLPAPTSSDPKAI